MPHTGDNQNPTPDLGLRGLPLLDHIINTIQEQREHWNQGTWARTTVIPESELPEQFQTDNNMEITELPTGCGTAMCVAGWAVHLSGDTLLWQPRHFWDDYSVGFFADRCRTPEGKTLTIRQRAQELLGLTEYQADTLFSGGNSLRDIKWTREVIADSQEERQEVN